MSNLSKRYGVLQTIISRWEEEFLVRSSKIFAAKVPDEKYEKER